MGVGSLDTGDKGRSPICQRRRGSKVIVVVDISSEKVGNRGLGAGAEEGKGSVLVCECGSEGGDIGSVGGSSLGEELVGKCDSAQRLAKEPGTSGDFRAVVGFGRVTEVGEAGLDFSFVGVGREFSSRGSL